MTDSRQVQPCAKPRRRGDPRHRIGVAVRAVAAIGGGYALAGSSAAAIALYLPGPRADAAMTGTMLAFVIYPLAVIWAFAARSAWRAGLGLLAAAVLPGVLLAVHYLGERAA